MLGPCKHFDDGHCRAIETVSGRAYKVSKRECAVCGNVKNPQDINCFTLSLGNSLATANEDWRLSFIKKEIEECQDFADVNAAREKVYGQGIVDVEHFNLLESIQAAEYRSVAGGGTGTELKKLVSWFASQEKGCKCKSREKMMNRWGPDGCENRIEQIADWLMEEAAHRNLPSGGFARTAARVMIKRAIANSRKRPKRIKRRDETFHVAITTAPRKEPTIHKAIASFRNAGWEPTVYAEPGSEATDAKTIWNQQRLGIWHNWLASVRHSLETTSQPFIITAQDDIAIHPQAKDLANEIIERGSPYTDGFFSFYTPRHYARNRYAGPGIKKVNTKSLWGACCLMWKREVLEKVIADPLVEKWIGAPVRTKSARKRIYERRRNDPSLVANSDTAIGKIVRGMELPMYFVVPSPAIHIARYSSISHGGNHGNRNCAPCANHSEPLRQQINGAVS